MSWWAVLCAGWIWLASGPTGFEAAFAICGLAIVALATIKLLDFVSPAKGRRVRSQGMKIWKPRQVELSAFARQPRAQIYSKHEVMLAGVSPSHAGQTKESGAA